METMRKPFQGVFNIIRFNWHFYVFALALVFSLIFAANYVHGSLQFFLYLASFLISISTMVSLLASFYVYDLSGLYHFDWLHKNNTENLIVNINAGFDETSALLQDKFKDAELIALDFYDPLKHTEISIKRARKAYPPFPGTQQVETTRLPLPDNAADKIFAILAAHEIRNEVERAAFFKELSRIIKPNGQIIVIEHLRDSANFLAYNIGFFHFYSKSTWLKIFRKTNLTVQQEIKQTPFISTFILKKNGNTN